MLSTVRKRIGKRGFCLVGLIALIAALVATVSGSYFVAVQETRANLSVTRASVGELAHAMVNDEFYSDYNNSTLVVSASVESVRSSRHGSIILLRHGGVVRCALQPGSRRLYSGDRVALVAEGARAEREPYGVLLQGCVVL